jgi:hypothetical protein
MRNEFPASGKGVSPVRMEKFDVSMSVLQSLLGMDSNGFFDLGRYFCKKNY